MNPIQSKYQAEITRIFDEYYAKLDEINRRVDEKYPQTTGQGTNSSIDNNYKKLAEIITKRHQDSQYVYADEDQVNSEAPKINDELEIKIEKAKTSIDECRNELQIIYGDLDKVVDNAWKKLECFSS